jgi:hypothetical protein
MYEPYPSGGQAPAPGQRPPAPPSVRTAVKLMYGGAVVSAISLILGLFTLGSTRHAISAADPRLTPAQVGTAVSVEVTVVLVGGLIGIGLWLWMAWASGRGHNWARITGTVFFGLYTLGMIGDVSRPAPVGSRIVEILSWVIGLATVVMLWRGESGAFFRQPAYYYQPPGYPPR